MNPYAKYLGNLDALEVIQTTPRELVRLLRAMGPERAGQAPAPGKWSAREIVCHLADCELVFAFRLRQTLAETNPVIQPFDQEKWAAAYGGYDVEAALAVFGAVRQWNLAFIRQAGPQALSLKMTHPERGKMTFQTVVETMGGHDRNHLQQIERLSN